MADTTRRLSAEMREWLADRIRYSHDIPQKEAVDALHDLDVADRELAAAQATIAERTEDAIVLGEKLKFCEMDNYTKGEAIEDYNQRLKEQAQKLTQQGAVIAAMREVIDEWMDFQVANRGNPKDGNLQHHEFYHCYTYPGNKLPPIVSKAKRALSKSAQLAADHDAAVRADERRKVLEEAATVALGHQISETSLCAEWGRQCAAAIRRLHRPIEQLAAQPEEAGE